MRYLSGSGGQNQTVGDALNGSGGQTRLPVWENLVALRVQNSHLLFGQETLHEDDTGSLCESTGGEL